jgi:hypothetical protein
MSDTCQHDGPIVDIPHQGVTVKRVSFDGSEQEFAKCSIGGQLSVFAKTKPTSGGEIALWAVTRRRHR